VHDAGVAVAVELRFVRGDEARRPEDAPGEVVEPRDRVVGSTAAR
jgi:hypothetical protein